MVVLLVVLVSNLGVHAVVVVVTLSRTVVFMNLTSSFSGTIQVCSKPNLGVMQ